MQDISYINSSLKFFKLLDVRHSAKRVAVLGQCENGVFTLSSHDKTDVDNYLGRVYQTPQLYVNDTI